MNYNILQKFKIIMFFNKMYRTLYKKSNDLSIHSKNPYPYYPTENIEDNPYLEKNWKKVSFNLDDNIFVDNNNFHNNVVDNNNFHNNFHTNVVDNNVVDNNVVDNNLKMTYKTKNYPNTSNPEVWGPAFWFSLHNGAIRYPNNASPIWKERMKNFILGIPVMLPCEKCSDDATSYLESNYFRINDVVSGKEKLFKFFWEFHNYVNKKLGKKQISLEEAYNMYMGNAKIKCLIYS
jgi:hypothetical protein